MSTFTSLKYVHHVLCPECQSWIKETARRCPMCGQLTGLSTVEVVGDDALGEGGGGGGGGGRAGSSHKHKHANTDDDDDDDDDNDPNDTERQRRGSSSKSRMRGFGKLWGSTSR